MDEVEHYIEGRQYISREYKKQGNKELIFNEFKGTGRMAKHVSSIPWSRKSKVLRFIRELFGDSAKIAVSAGRTMCIGEYEYARIEIYLEAYPKSGKLNSIDKDKASNMMFTVIKEILERERTSILDIEREDVDIEWDDSFLHRRIIGVNYGLTLQSKIEKEFYYLDLGLTEPISDDADLSSEILRIQDDVAARLDEQRLKMQKQDANLDLGI